MKENLTIILISGKARHGKTTFANMLKEEHSLIGRKAVATSFAKYLKMYAKEVTGWDGREETKPREFLQNLGTHVRKQLGHPNFFVNRLDEDLDVYSMYADIVIIDDARLSLEIEYFKNRYPNDTKTVKIMRPNYENDLDFREKTHETEVELDDYDAYDYTIINDGSLEDLKIKAHDLYERIEKE